MPLPDPSRVLESWSPWCPLENCGRPGAGPFVKRGILRDPEAELVARKVRDVFGVDVEEWL